jgi:hypothetical protein
MYIQVVKTWEFKSLCFRYAYVRDRGSFFTTGTNDVGFNSLKSPIVERRRKLVFLLSRH